ncbi:MAG: hypothetical protein HC915_17055 [Anaerolineae bacterium]|nr:hypothetical protein [Anaerolineae bacterium]
MSIPVYYTPLHQGHAPAHEFYQGRVLPYPEHPGRIEQLRADLSTTPGLALVTLQYFLFCGSPFACTIT